MGKITTVEGIKEYAIRTLEPEKDVRGAALKQRIDNIKEQNIHDGYLRQREDIEEEIKQRQLQYISPGGEEPPDEPPITRRNRN